MEGGREGERRERWREAGYYKWMEVLITNEKM